MKISQAQIALIQREAERGEALAQFNLGWMYLKGRGLRRDASQALFWYLKAGEGGDVTAQEALRKMYYLGIGTAADFAQSAQWAKRAAWFGNVQSQANLGMLYLKGRGVEADRAMAYAWLTIAGKYGYRNWRHAILKRFVGRSLTREQLEKSQAFVMSWQKIRRKKLAASDEAIPPLLGQE